MSEKCKHRFVLIDKYESKCRLCGVQKFKCDDFASKIILGIFGFDPNVFKAEYETIKYLYKSDMISFYEYCIFMDKEDVGFSKISVEEKFIKFIEQKRTQLKNEKT
jgi:hypothetical protein